MAVGVDAINTPIETSVVSVSLAGKTLVLPSCSDSLVDNFAIDWIIESLGLKSVAVLASPFVTPMVQSNAFSGDSASFTTAMEVYASGESSVAAVQIRSSVTAKSNLASQLIELAKSLQVKSVLVVGSASGFLQSGDTLENGGHLRIAGNVADIQVAGMERIETHDIHQGGMLTHFLSRDIPALVAITRGTGFLETRMLSEESALAVLTATATECNGLRPPLSIKTLDAPPRIGVEVSRILE